MKAFHYSPLAAQKVPVRLLRLLKGDAIEIRCEIFHASIGDHDGIPYEALSYTWGCTELVERIDVKGRRLRITDNLHSALQCLRSHNKDRVLWVDAICINQADQQERSDQVQNMGTIFASAERVIFWLGKPTAEAELLMSSLREFQKEYTNTAHKGLPVDKTCLKQSWCSTQRAFESQDFDLVAQQQRGLSQLLRRPWFERVWILQEVANARSGVVCVGASSVSADIFALGPELLGVEVDSHVQSVLDMMPGSAQAGLRWSQGRSHIQLVSKFYASKASDERDIIFALLGLLPEVKMHELLMIDYTKSIQLVVHHAIRYWLETTSVHISQVLSCLTRFRSVRITCLVPWEEATDARQAVRVPLQLGEIIAFTEEAFSATQEVIECSRKASSLLVEQHHDEQPFSRNGSCFAELDQLVSRLNARQLLDGDKYSDALRIISPRGANQNVTFLIIQDPREALLLVGRNSYTQLFVFIANGSVNDKHGLLNSILYKAAAENYMNVVELLLEQGADIDTPDYYNRTALYVASARGHIETVRLLLDRGAYVDAQAGDYSTALHVASNTDRTQIVRLLLEKDANVDIRDSYGRTTLYMASARGHTETVGLLLDRGADINARGNDHDTALVAASTGGHIDTVQLLLNRGADIDAQGGDHSTALQAALHGCHVEIIQLLLSNGADANAISEHCEPQTWRAFDGAPLQNASARNYIQTVQLLLDRGVNVDGLGVYSEPRTWRVVNSTALQAASAGNHIQIVQLLLDAGADVNARGGDYGTALQAASQRSHMQVMQLLYRHGARI